MEKNINGECMMAINRFLIINIFLFFILACGGYREDTNEYLIGVYDINSQLTFIEECRGQSIQVFSDIKVIHASMIEDALNCYKQYGTYRYIEENYKVYKAEF